MDPQTLATYEANAARFSAAYRSIQPVELQRLMRAFFHAGQLTADIGCGIGRDTAWLTEQGFPTIGVDASPAMLREARSLYPDIALRQGALPELAGLGDGQFGNVLCSAVLMHLGREHLITAAMNLARILKPDGRMILSYRRSRGQGDREADGRLFTDIPAGKLVLLLEATGLQVVQSLTQPDPGRPDVHWVVILAQKTPQQVPRGLERVQSVLAQDRKDATYKFALLRALCAISRTQPNIVAWGDGCVYVPLRPIAVCWVQYYWPFLTDLGFVAQKRGEAPGSLKRLAFRGAMAELAGVFGPGGLYALLQELDVHPARYRRPLRRIAETIRDGPVYYSGTHDRLFQFQPAAPGPGGARVDGQFGWVRVPEPIWLDICRFNHWIEDSLVLRWAQLTAEMNPGKTPGEFVPLLLRGVADERDTAAVRALLAGLGRPLTCVWSGARLVRGIDVDHVIPYAAWGNNDWWNLLPALPALNNQKRDALPTRNLLRHRRDDIIGYWQVYRNHQQPQFDRQVSRALGLVTAQNGWEGIAFAGLQEAVERVAVTRGLARWEP